eukprot:6104266-Pyramimonas_sp.AAC.1
MRTSASTTSMDLPVLAVTWRRRSAAARGNELSVLVTTDWRSTTTSACRPPLVGNLLTKPPSTVP